MRSMLMGLPIAHAKACREGGYLCLDDVVELHGRFVETPHGYIPIPGRHRGKPVPFVGAPALFLSP
jgi:hypothetical protein